MIYLFDGDFSLVKSSSVVDGQDIQKDTKPFTQEDWCKSANLGITPYKCTNPQTKQKANPPYYVLNNLQLYNHKTEINFNKEEAFVFSHIHKQLDVVKYLIEIADDLTIYKIGRAHV